MTEINNYKLSLMISVFEIERPSEDFEKYYLETHGIWFDENGKPQMKEGRPLSADTFDTMREFFTDRRLVNAKERILYGNPSSFLHIDMRFEKQEYIWKMDAKKVKLLFDKDTKIKDGAMWTPSLIFYAKKASELAVFAVKDEVIKPNTKLYNAPFLNVYQEGNVCLGTASREKIKKTNSLETYRTEWENLFFLTKFSHGIAAYPTIVKSKNIHRLTKNLIQSGKRFPLSELVQNTEYPTFNDLVNSL